MFLIHMFAIIPGTVTPLMITPRVQGKNLGSIPRCSPSSMTTAPEPTGIPQELPSGPSPRLILQETLRLVTPVHDCLDLGVVVVLVALTSTGHAVLGEKFGLTVDVVGQSIALGAAFSLVIVFFEKVRSQIQVDWLKDRWAKFLECRTRFQLKIAVLFGSEFGGLGRWCIVLFGIVLFSTTIGVVEEVLYRGCLHTGLDLIFAAISSPEIATILAILSTSIFFGALHYRGSRLFAFFFGLAAGTLFVATENLVFPIIMHAVVNINAHLATYIQLGRFNNDQRLGRAMKLDDDAMSYVAKLRTLRSNLDF